MSHDQDRPLYEQWPYIYVALALLSFFATRFVDVVWAVWVLRISGVILVISGAYVFKMRFTYRREIKRLKAKFDLPPKKK